MRFGYFDDENREYVITQPDTPLPWLNYLGSDNFFGLISNTAGGYTFYRDARLRRLTRYRYNNVPFDRGGRYLYLRDNQSSDYWSPTWQPTSQPLENYACRVGLGYTKISSEFSGIKAEICYFIPSGQTLEIWQLQLTNRRDQPVDISLFSCVEFCLWDAWDDATNFQRNLSIGEVEVQDSVIYHKTEYRERRDHFAYFACSEPLAGFDTQREVFLGTYRGWDRPQVVESGISFNSIAYGWSPVGSHHVQLQMKPGEAKQVIFLLGYHENPKDSKFESDDNQIINKKFVRPTIERFLKRSEMETALENLNGYWNDLLNIYQVDTPDEHVNRMVNTWNAVQCLVTFNMSRSASYFESGIGRGIGFRDSNQDLLGFVHMLPERARQRILDLASTQLDTGGAYHQYQPLTKRGNDAVGSNFNDDPLWLVLSVVAYIKETGDFAILQEQVPFDNEPGSELPLYDHLRKSIHYTLDRLGPHGLPLIGRADWNDCLNLNTFSSEPGESFQTTTSMDGQTAESVFIAGLFVLAAKELADLVENYGISEDAIYFRSAATKMEETTLQHGWDGEWFLRAYDHFGQKIGSKENQEGQIFIEPQGMCIMASIGKDDSYAADALASVKERLLTPHGIVLQQPAYSKYYLQLGEISTYPPGYKENAGIFCHTNPWIMIAEALQGNGDQALDYYLRINPSFREEISEVHRCEPYVYAQMIAGRDAPTHGEAKNSWLTGTAAWNYVAITQWILGIRPSYHGLQIEPVIPKTWSGFTAHRKYRDAVYHVSVKRVGDGKQVSLKVDGQAIEGTIAPFPEPGSNIIQVDVEIR